MTGYEKQRLWNEIRTSVNALGRARSLESVKHRYQDCRRELKLKMTKEHRDATRTGGGPPRKYVYERWEELLKPHMPQVAVLGIPQGVETSRLTIPEGE